MKIRTKANLRFYGIRAQAKSADEYSTSSTVRKLFKCNTYAKKYRINYIALFLVFLVYTNLNAFAQIEARNVVNATRIIKKSNLENYNYGFAKYGTLKYDKNFKYFNYVNPKAPKQGVLTLSAGNALFDKFNPFSLKGVSAPAISTLMFDTLGVASLDEDSSIYGLIADGIRINNNNNTINFHINPQAKFNNGDDIKAIDVKFSFDNLIKNGAPTFKFLYQDIDNASVIDDDTISFKLKHKNPEMPLLLAALPVFSNKWLQGKSLDKITLEPPIASSVYLIDKYYQGRSISYKLNPNYWAINHPVRKGLFNFKSIHFENYQDDIAKLEALKSLNFDVNVEYRAKNWAKSYTGKAFTSGQLIKQEFINHNGNGMQGFAFNTRKELFNDVRIRKALSLALDFDWMNKQLFYNSYQRLNSYFSNTIYASNPVITEKEKFYLDKAGFNLNEQIINSINNNSNIKYSLRENLLAAQKLLQQAGWIYKNGSLRNDKNQVFSFEILEAQGGLSRVIAAYIRNLQKLGIQVTYKVLDPSIYQKRLENFDFDMVSVRYGDSNLPGNELIQRFSSKSANINGSDNIIGVNDKKIDNLLQFITSSTTKDSLIASTKALDRVLLNQYYIIPHWYTNKHRVAYRKSLHHHVKLPLFYNAEDWVISTWWSQ